MRSKVEQIHALKMKKIELEVLGKKNREAIAEKQQAVVQLYKMMFAHREVDQLYRQIHEWARVNRIEVLALKKLGVESITEPQKETATQEKKEADPLFYRIRLMLKSRGEFIDYLALREALLGFGKMIHVDREKIRSVRLLNSGSREEERYQDQGKVVVEMELSAYQSDATDGGRDDEK